MSVFFLVLLGFYLHIFPVLLGFTVFFVGGLISCWVFKWFS